MDMKEIVMGKLPMLVRYALLTAAGWLASRGMMGDEQSALLSANMDAIVGGIVGLIVIVWGWRNKPSLKAQEAAKQIDAQVPAAASVIIKTPVGQADIVIPGKTAR